MKTNQMTAIKVPGGYLKDICEATGQIEATKVLAHAEWYKSAEIARSVARFLIGSRCVSTSGVYTFQFDMARACK